MPFLITIPADIQNHCLGGSVIAVIEITVSVQRFPVNQPNRLSGLPVQPQRYIPGDFLSKVHNRFALWCLKNSPWPNPLLLRDQLPLLGNQNVL